MKRIVVSLALAAPLLGFAQQVDVAQRRAAYQQQLAVQEVERLAGQFEVMSSNIENISVRLQKLENRPQGDADLKNEVAALRAGLQDVKRQQAAMKQEIVAELSAKMAALMKQHATPPPPPPQPKPTPKPQGPQITGDYYEYTIEQGQTLSEIARVYKTSVKAIQDANGIKNPASVRVGQKIIIPVPSSK